MIVCSAFGAMYSCSICSGWTTALKVSIVNSVAPQVLRGFVIKVPCRLEHSFKKLSVVDVLVMQVLGGRPSRSLRLTCSKQPCLVIEHLLWAREPALKSGLMVPEEEEHLTLSLASVNTNSYCTDTHSRLEI